MPLMLCVMLEVFTIDEIAVEEKYQDISVIFVYKVEKMFLHWSQHEVTVSWSYCLKKGFWIKKNKTNIFLLWIFLLKQILNQTLILWSHFTHTLLHHSSTVRILSNLQQDLLHIPVFPWRIHQLCDPLLKGSRQRHQLDELAFRTFVHLKKTDQNEIRMKKSSGIIKNKINTNWETGFGQCCRRCS